MCEYANQHMESFRKLPGVAPISIQSAHLQHTQNEADAIVFSFRVSVAHLEMRVPPFMFSPRESHGIKKSQSLYGSNPPLSGRAP